MISEELLRQAVKAASDVLAADFPEAYEEPAHEFSPEYRRAIDGLIYKLGRKPFYSTVKKVASVVLVISLLSSIWFGIGVEGRAVVFGWFKEKYETFFHYFFEGESSGPVTDAEYELGWMPEGYEILHQFEANGWKTFLYINKDNNYLKLSYSKNQGQADPYLLDEDCVTEIVNVNGLQGEVHLYKHDNVGNDIVWEDDENVLFVITAHESKSNLVKMAENIKKSS